MFTGIIESTAKILKLTTSDIVIARPALFDDLAVGCSIAVSGTCLTVTAFDTKSMHFDIVPTTFQKTKLGSLNIGDLVNVERAMPAHGRFEGHIVLGHSEATGKVKRVEAGYLTITIPQHLTPFVVRHGCIMIDGVALTVAELRGSEVTIAVIPHTLSITTLGDLTAGDTVNLETDVLAKYILKAHVTH